MNANRNYSITVIMAVALVFFSTAAHVQELISQPVSGETEINPEKYLNSITERQATKEVKQVVQTNQPVFGYAIHTIEPDESSGNVEPGCFSECVCENKTYQGKHMHLHERDHMEKGKHQNKNHMIYP